VLTVIETPTFLSDAKAAGLNDQERAFIVTTIAGNPLAGDLIPGTGGARKIRFGGKARGKSGGYRVIFHQPAEDVPLFLLALVNKGERADISQADRNELRRYLGTLADTYRQGASSITRKAVD
jgi:hypothetical protein